jgi:ubiquinone/menaquinone biosynthesis C-methylase UbiE
MRHRALVVAGGGAMSFGRRHVAIDESKSWVFNRMVDAYAARPPYPEALLDALHAAVRGAQRVLDVGAGLGHVAIPLASRGLTVSAVEPAEAMLERLVARANREGVALSGVHAKAEALPWPSASFDLVVVADALHFIDVELAARELDRVLAPGAALAVVTSSLDATPFMSKVRTIIDEATPRRPRLVKPLMRQLFRLTRVRPESERVFRDAKPVSSAELDAILRSISFIGPAMNAERSLRFRERIMALSEEPVWARRLELYLGRASLRRRPSSSAQGFNLPVPRAAQSAK